MSLRQTPDAPSDQLLRALAAVPVGNTILDLGCGRGQHTEALLRLGFPLHACDPRPEAVQETRARVRELVDEETAQSCVRQTSLEALDTLDATFDWIVASRPEAFLDSDAELPVLLEKGRGLLEPGGWLYLTMPASPEDGTRSASPEEERFRVSTSDLEAEQLAADLVESRPPSRVTENGEVRIHALYRRVAARSSA